MSRTVLPWSVFPAQLPIQTTALAWLVMDRLHAPGWVYGVVGTVLALFWGLAIVRMCTDKAKPLAGYGVDK